MKKQRLDKLNKRLNGYHSHFKGRFLLLQNHTLTLHEYILWDFSYSVLADWDTSPSHKDIYGTFPHKFSDIAKMLSVDPSFVSRHSKKLFDLNFWKRLEDRIEVVGYPVTRHLAKITEDVGILNFLDYIAQTHPTNAEMKDQDSKLQDTEL
jgi:DNA-binding MarR family transcriptional regulator